MDYIKHNIQSLQVNEWFSDASLDWHFLAFKIVFVFDQISVQQSVFKKKYKTYHIETL